VLIQYLSALKNYNYGKIGTILQGGLKRKKTESEANVTAIVVSVGRESSAHPFFGIYGSILPVSDSGDRGQAGSLNSLPSLKLIPTFVLFW
jgi:hypothetical protein